MELLDEHIPWKGPQNSSFTKAIKGMCRQEGPGTIEKCCGGVPPLCTGVEGRGTSLKKSPPQVMPTQGLHLITANKVGVIIKQAAKPEWQQ